MYTINFVRIPKYGVIIKSKIFSKEFYSIENTAKWFYNRWPSLCIESYGNFSKNDRRSFLLKVSSLRRKYIQV